MRTAFVFVTDERGFELARHAAMSVALSQEAPCAIHIFCYKFLPAELPNFTAALAKHRARLHVRRVSDPDVEHFQTCGHVTTPTLLKLTAVSELIGQYDRVVYLDNDILVLGDLAVDRIAFGSSPLAAVIDMDLSTTGVMRSTAWVAGGTATVADYFNAGVLIFAAENWRDMEFRQTYAAALHQHDSGCGYKIDCTSIDQCALNTTFRQDWVRLPPTYNMQAGAKFTKYWKTAAVRHYCGPRKFLPLAPFRSDRRDVRTLNRIRRAMRLPEQPLAVGYEALFRLNVLRNRRPARVMRRFLAALDAAETADANAA